MKILIRKEPSVVGICPICGSKLEIEKGLAIEVTENNNPYK